MFATVAVLLIVLQGFTDKEYRKRRKQIADIAFDFR